MLSQAGPSVRSDISLPKTGYLHGYAEEEQQRLIDQALYLEPRIFHGVDYSKAGRVLEVGCGVGAQMEILLRRFPGVRATGVDRSEAQTRRARVHLKHSLDTDRAEVQLSRGESLPFATGTFDGAFLCWFLEHVPSPPAVLGEVRRVMAEGGVLYCTEVFNASLFIHPRCPAIEEFWGHFNRQQIRLGGDPHMGAKLGALLDRAGFKEVSVEMIPLELDGRTEDAAERERFVGYWRSLFMSAVPSLMEAKSVDALLVRQVREELERIAESREAIFHAVVFQARAVK